MLRRLAASLLLAAVLAFGACVQATAPTDTGGGLTLGSSSGRPIPVTYARDLQPVFASDCVSCHNATSAAGGYSMADLASVLKAVRPGDASSPLVVQTQPPGHMFGHFTGDRLMKSSLVYIWVVEYGASDQGHGD